MKTDKDNKPSNKGKKLSSDTAYKKTTSKKKKASVENEGLKKTYIVKKKGKSKEKGVEINKRAIDSAKTKTGAFKTMKWQGKKVKAKGRTTAYKDSTGKVHKATNERQSRDLDTKYAYDRKKFVSDSTSNSARTKRFAKAIRQGSK